MCGEFNLFIKHLKNVQVSLGEFGSITLEVTSMRKKKLKMINKIV